MNIPIGILGFVIVQYTIPKAKVVLETKFDTIGALLFFSFLFLLIYYVTVSTYADLMTSLLLLGGFVLTFILFILRERSFESPIITIEVLTDKKISSSIFSALLSYMAMVPISFLLPFYLQDALGFSQSITGLFLVVQPLIISIVGPISGFISERVTAQIQTTIGLVVQLVGLLFIALAVPNVILMAVGIAIMATGLSVFSVANGNFIMTSAPKKYMGVVSALTNLARTTGFSVATALATTVFGFFFMITNPWNLTAGTFFVSTYGQAYQSTIFMFSFLLIIGAIISSFRGMNDAEIERCDISPVQCEPTGQTHPLGTESFA